MCSHNIVEDYIDINPDDFIQIFYCNKCFTTFGFEDYICCPTQLILLDSAQQPIDMSSNNEIPINSKQKNLQQCSSTHSYFLHESGVDFSSQSLILKDHENYNNHNHLIQENP